MANQRLPHNPLYRWLEQEGNQKRGHYLSQLGGQYAFNNISGGRLLRSDGNDADILRGIYTGQ